MPANFGQSYFFAANNYILLPQQYLTAHDGLVSMVGMALPFLETGKENYKMHILTC